MKREVLCGEAGTGKTFEARRRQIEDPSSLFLTATTGIAAVNLGTVTINSTLGFFDTDSLSDAYMSGKLTKRLAQLANTYRALGIDEYSMMHKEQLDIIDKAITEVNDYESIRHPLGVLLIGDFAQLPPVKGEWIFKSDCWPKYAENITRLTKVWRQDNPEFLKAINFIRRGQGAEGSEVLKNIATFSVMNDDKFDGTTIFGLNAQVDRFNFLSHSRVQGRMTRIGSWRWGEQRSEWKHIPETLELKDGAYVMILSNDQPSFSYANGDCGHVVEFTTHTNKEIDEDYEHQIELEEEPEDEARVFSPEEGAFRVELVRNKAEVVVFPVTRLYLVKEMPKDQPEPRLAFNSKDTPESMRPREPHYDIRKGRFVIGAVHYHPLRLAYASTVHKSQGLTLDRVQIDMRGKFFGSPHMMYVAISRCRTPEGLRLIGTPEMLRDRTKISKEVLPWL